MSHTPRLLDLIFQMRLHGRAGDAPEGQVVGLGEAAPWGDQGGIDCTDCTEGLRMAMAAHTRALTYLYPSHRGTTSADMGYLAEF